MSEGMKLHLKEVYIRLIVFPRRVFGLKSSKIGDHVQDIFGSSEKGENPMMLVEGTPGIGNTIFYLNLLM